jgi:hypothetical protein
LGESGPLVPARAPSDSSYAGEDTEGYFVTETRTFTNSKPRQITVTAHRINVDGTVSPSAAKYEAHEFWPDDVLRPRKSADPNGLQVSLSGTEARHGTGTAKVRSAWLWIPEKGQIKATLIAAEAEHVELSPTLEAMAYVSQGNVFVRQLQTVGREDLEAAMENEERKQLMSNAKQVAMGMMIYGADFDDLLPPSNGWQDTVLPYLKNRNLMEGFTYEMNGQDLTKITDPSKQRLGFIEGRFGRAITFADGHVIWERRKNP